MLFLTYLSAVLRSVIYGTSVLFTGNLTAKVDVLDVLALRFLMSFAVLWLLKITRILKIEVGIKEVVRKSKRSSFVLPLLLAAVLESVLCVAFETLGISLSTGVTAGVILSLTPIAVCVAESLILKEKTTWLQKLFLIIGVAGVCYIVIHTGNTQGSTSWFGILFLFLSVVSGALFCVFSRRSSQAFSAMERTYVISIPGMLVFNTINVVRHLIQGDIGSYFAPYANWENLIGFVFLAVLSTIVATGMNNFALARAQASTLSAFGGLTTVTTVVIGALSGEKLHLFHAVGLSMIFIGMIGVSYIQIKRDKKIGPRL